MDVPIPQKRLQRHSWYLVERERERGEGKIGRATNISNTIQSDMYPFLLELLNNFDLIFKLERGTEAPQLPEGRQASLVPKPSSSSLQDEAYLVPSLLPDLPPPGFEQDWVPLRVSIHLPLFPPPPPFPNLGVLTENVQHSHGTRIITRDRHARRHPSYLLLVYSFNRQPSRRVHYARILSFKIPATVNTVPRSRS